MHVITRSNDTIFIGSHTVQLASHADCTLEGIYEALTDLSVLARRPRSHQLQAMVMAKWILSDIDER